MFCSLKLFAALVLSFFSGADSAAGIAARASLGGSSAGAEGGWTGTGARQSSTAPSGNSAASAPAVAVPPRKGSADSSPSPAPEVAPQEPEVPATDGWEAQFAWGTYYSKVTCLASERSVGSWTSDAGGSGAGVPRQMLRAEELLAQATEAAPEDKQRAKLAERSLRLYYHAKWLAERNHATAAEFRYRQASQLARRSRRNVLAAHALGRLGYFLMHWHRNEEAHAVLLESRRISAKSNPLAPYLLGLLERQAAGSDVERLFAAEELIMTAGEQPSSELEVERKRLTENIQYWRQAESSVMNCFPTSDAAHMVICLLSHLFQRTHQAALG